MGRLPVSQFRVNKVNLYLSIYVSMHVCVSQTVEVHTLLRVISRLKGSNKLLSQITKYSFVSLCPVLTVPVIIHIFANKFHSLL